MFNRIDLSLLLKPAQLSRKVKNTAFAILDSLILPISLWLAFAFRLGFHQEGQPLGLFNPLSRIPLMDVGIVIGASLLVIYMAGLHRVKLHSFDLNAALRILATGCVLMAVASVSSFFRENDMPRSVAVYYGLTFSGLAITARMGILAALHTLQRSSAKRLPVAIYGAGLAGIQLATSLKHSSEVRPVLFVDDNPALHSLIVAGLTVKSPQVLELLAQSGKIQQVLIGTTSFPRHKRTALIEQMSRFGCEVKIIPSYIDLISGKKTVNDLHPMSTDDLLGREAVDLNVPEIAKAYAGRVVMVTGAGGSIGSELCRQLMNCAPHRIVLFERSEFSLYDIERQLRPLCVESGINLVARLASVTDPAAVSSVIEQENVDVVLHAAAYKHVPLVEDNEVEGARNNVLGTQVVAEAAARAEVERFILISTDKAVRPTNIMGATKRLAELVTGDMQLRHMETKFSMVRFGNVLGSSGSVVPLFLSQIEAGGPVTVTHEQVTRYFMTIPEAARLVLLAGAFSTGGDIFVLNMGEPIKIRHLARRMIELSGHTVCDADNPNGDIEIIHTGLRPGEKLYEELLIDDESLMDTPHEKIFRANFNGKSEIEVAAMIRKIRSAVEERDQSLVRQAAGIYADGYTSDNSTGAASAAEKQV